MSDRLTSAEFAVLRHVAESRPRSQRSIADATDLALGTVNLTLKKLSARGLVDGLTVTPTGMDALEPYRVDNAVLLAAGFGHRMVPFTYETPKGLLKVHGIPMIERQIQQLHERGITCVTIVVGYLKERFDYLIDKYGVKLVANPEYATKNNFVSVYRALSEFKNTYLLVADDWIEDNMFHTFEYDSWMSGVYVDGPTAEWGVTLGAHQRITRIDTSGRDTWVLLGPAYFSRDCSTRFADLVRDYYARPGTGNYYWEDIVRENLKTLPMRLNRQPNHNVHEFESLEDLRLYDQSYAAEAGNRILQEISEEFGVAESGITDIAPLKEGMTNQSFVFRVAEDRYVFRRPGPGTERLIDRAVEKAIYDQLAQSGLTDEVVRFDPATGHRITRFWEGSRVADGFDDADLALCMGLGRDLHERAIQVPNSFDIARMINRYEALCDEVNAIRFSDYREVRRRADELLEFRSRLVVPEVLCHCDLVSSNVLVLPDGTGRLIDWEYAGMADPLLDVAMFAIYSYFDRARLDLALRLYLDREPTPEETCRTYMYVALGGLLWSLWAEYRQAQGTEFGDYPLVQYRYMKDYHRILKAEDLLEATSPRGRCA